jgi:hypothetical protein
MTIWTAGHWDFFRGLKPNDTKHLLSELKLRPPKEQTFSASCEDVPSRGTGVITRTLKPTHSRMPRCGDGRGQSLLRLLTVGDE